MYILSNTLLLLIGLALLVYGADRLVEGASSLAHCIGISNLIIGLTIVAFGTSLPELTVNVVSSLKKTSDLALGNIVGSNIFNILIILGISACITPLEVKYDTKWVELPYTLLSAITLLVVANDTILFKNSNNTISQLDGIILLIFFLLFMGYVTLTAFRNRTEEPPTKGKYSVIGALFYIVVGIILLIIGSRLAVQSSINIAHKLQVSERIIGLTIVAIGTSLPELATSIVATKKREIDIAIANVVGSNIFNVFFVLGITSLINPIVVTGKNDTDLMVNLFATIILFGMLFIGRKQAITLPKGIILIVGYVAYMCWLFYSTFA